MVKPGLPKVIAITGSCGKTTVKEMRLHSESRTCPGKPRAISTMRSVCLTCQADAGASVCCAGAGANHPGEIAWTTSLAKPDVALINNVLLRTWKVLAHCRSPWPSRRFLPALASMASPS